MQYKERVHACWLGKAIGGTLGAPHEGVLEPLQLTFYDPVPAGILPNDDLDLQLVWIHHLRTMGARAVTPELMAEAWRKHVKFPFDEYAYCLRNLEMGLTGSDVGAYDNWFAECMGAAIRSEIWACLAPGEPERAAGFAWCDAVCDHCGEGVWAEVFFAALQSAAFVEQDMDKLLDGALDMLPSDSLVRLAIEDTRKWWSRGPGVMDVREKIVEKYGAGNFTDVKANLAFTILGWLAGGGDFGKSICIATNCGLDTDCTAATLGALLGILNPQSIPEEWARPIGEDIVVSPPIVGIQAPATLRELTRWTLELREQLAGDCPQIREIRPCRPVTVEESIAVIPARIVSGCSPGEMETGWESLPWEEVKWGGNWVELPAVRKAGTGVAFSFELKKPTDCLVMACAPAPTRVWLDGVELAGSESDKICAGSLGPSFHRGGRVVFEAGLIGPGAHDLVIWIDRAAEKGCELIFGLSDSATKLWLLTDWLPARTGSMS